MQACSFVLLLVGLTSLCCAGPSGFLSWNGLVVTDNGLGNQLTLENPISFGHASQTFEYTTDGTIALFTNNTRVLDVASESTNNGARVVLWIKKTGTPQNLRNQQWNLYTNPARIESRLVSGFNLQKSSTSKNLVMSYLNPAQRFSFITAPFPTPATCTSWGDPHFTCWAGKQFDFHSTNSILLAHFSRIKVYAVHVACGSPGITCNEGIVVQIPGESAFQLTKTQAYYNKKAVTLPTGTTTYSTTLSVQKRSVLNYVINFPGAYITYTTTGEIATVEVTITTAMPQDSFCFCPEANTRKRTPPPPGWASQYEVQSQNETQYNYTTAPFSYDPNYVPNYGPYTTNDAALIANAIALCSVLQSGALYNSCAPYVPPEDYYDTCYDDTIASGNLQFAQSSIDSYTNLCFEVTGRNNTNDTVVLPTSPAQSAVWGAGLNSTITHSFTNITFVIQARDSTYKNRLVGGDNITVTSTPALTFKITDNNNGTYIVSYVPSQLGKFTIAVKLGVSSVGDSPFNITVIEDKSISAKNCYAFGAGVAPLVESGIRAPITIQAKTASNTTRTTGGDIFRIAFSAGGFFVTDPIVDNNDGTYSSGYIAYALGDFTVSITLLSPTNVSTNISGSPYAINVF